MIEKTYGFPFPAAWGRVIGGKAVTVSLERTDANDEPLFALHSGEAEQTPAGMINWKMEAERANRLLADTQSQLVKCREALVLAEDVLSRAPFSTQLWPNGMHPNRGIEQIRSALTEPVVEEKPMKPSTPVRRRIIMEEGCITCAELAAGSFGPSHDPSPRCESGKRPHCTCDICF
jgi:hypothetical protein